MSQIIETETTREEQYQEINRRLRNSLLKARADLDDAYVTVAKVAMQRNDLATQNKALEERLAEVEADFKSYRDAMVERLAAIEE